MVGGAGRRQTAESVDQLICAFDEHDELRAAGIAEELIANGRVESILDTAADYAPTSRIAMNVLVEALDASGIVHRFAGAMLLDRSSVDDVAQDSLISIVESIGSYRGGSRVSSWAHTIVQRRVVDYLRRQRESTPLVDEHSPTVRMSSMIAARTTVREALAKLPELYRVPVVLRDIEGLSYAEVARRLDRGQGTVKSQISRGRALIGGMLGDDRRGTDATE